MKAFTLQDAIKKQCKHAEFNKLYDRQLVVNAIATMIVELRSYAKLTQNQLAQRAGTTQSVIARLESGTDKRIPSIDLLARIATASNAKLNFSFNIQKTQVRK